MLSSCLLHRDYDMALAPQKMREIVFLLLYSFDFSQSESDDMTEMLMHELSVSKSAMREAHARKVAICQLLPEIDRLLSSHSNDYVLERIPRVERNILRLAIYELILDPKIPFKVVMAEAIRLTKKFATVEAIAFVNAVLGAIRSTDAPSEEITESSEELEPKQEPLLLG